jgi:membrane protease YdiL (CAAX protease family)
MALQARGHAVTGSASMQIGRASGVQIAFFTFAGLLLVVPATRWILRANDWSTQQAAFIERCLAILAMGAVLVAIPPLRRWCSAQLAISVPAAGRREVWIVALAEPLVAFALVGFMLLWRWTAEGPAGLAQWVRSWPSPQAQIDLSLTAAGFAMLLTQAVIGPVIEELVFRGLLYTAWEERWGWVAAMLLSAAVFGLYHGGFWHAFVGGLIYAALYRRTGSLLAPILAHGIYNASLWYPFLGRHVMPGAVDVPGDLATWWFHLTALLVCVVAIPAYLFMARRPIAPNPTLPR